MDYLLFCVRLKFSRDASTCTLLVRSRFCSPACGRRSVHVGSCPIWHARWPVRATAARLYSCLLSPCNCQLLPYGTRPAHALPVVACTPATAANGLPAAGLCSGRMCRCAELLLPACRDSLVGVVILFSFFFFFKFV